MTISGCCGAAGLVLLLGVPVAALAGPGGRQAPQSLPKPGAEHQLFKMDEGTWDAAIELSPPDGPAMTSKGVEVNTIGCGGMCIITDFKGEAMPGVPFTGHGVGTWDTAKKKYVVSWTDSMSQGLAIGEASWDPVKKQLAGWVEGPDMTGKVMKMRTLGEYKAPDTRVFTSFAPGPDGKEIQTMRITYTRRKAAQ